MTALVTVDKTNSQAALFVSSIVAPAKGLIDTANMDDAADPPIYRALLAIKPAGLKLGTWAAQAGLARNAFNGIRKHGNPTNATLQKLLDVIGADMSALDRSQGMVQTEVRGASGSVHEMSPAYHAGDISQVQTIPLLGTATGGEYGNLDEHIELTELYIGEVIERLVRPTKLAGDDDAYALTVVGDSMSPRYDPGERVGVSPRAPVGIGDDVIVQLRGLDGEDERVKMVLIKRLVRRTATHVELRQFTPPMDFRVERARVAALHKVAFRY